MERPSAWKCAVRERINDIAAEVAKLAMQLEDRIRRSRPCCRRTGDFPAKAARAANGVNANAGVSEGGGTLAERIGRCSPTPHRAASSSRVENSSGDTPSGFTFQIANI